MNAVYRAALVEGARAAGVAIDDTLADAITRHYLLVAKWAAKINLTAVTDPKSAASIHGVDSLLFLEHIEAGSTAACVDIGSGAGFPGVIIALARPELAMTLLEPKRKRASFLRVALAELERPDVAVVEARFEEIAPAELLISRATIPPLQLVEGSATKLKPGGRLIVTSGAGAPSVPALTAAAEKAKLVHQVRAERRLPTGETRILDVFARPRDRP